MLRLIIPLLACLGSGPLNAGEGPAPAGAATGALALGDCNDAEDLCLFTARGGALKDKTLPPQPRLFGFVRWDASGNVVMSGTGDAPEAGTLRPQWRPAPGLIRQIDFNQ